jgi:NitT/TauT family transport system permease protein
MKIFGYKVPLMSSLLLWGLLWEIIGRSKLTYFIPSVSEIFLTFLEIYKSDAFVQASTETAYAFFLGSFFSIIIGVPVGILMGKNKIVDDILLPWVNLFISAPLSALVPVLMILFGFGMKAIIITTFLFAVWIIVLNSRAGVMQINRSLVEMAKSFCASNIDSFFKIYFWAALPEIISGIRIGCIRAVKGVVIGQLLISIVGFGALFELYSANFLMAHFWVVIFVLFFMAFTLSEILAYIENKLAYYASNR